MNNNTNTFRDSFRAQKIIAQWIVDGFDFIDIASGKDWYQCIDPDDADQNPAKYVPFWYDHGPKAIERLAEFLRTKGYKEFKNGEWIK